MSRIVWPSLLPQQNRITFAFLPGLCECGVCRSCKHWLLWSDVLQHALLLHQQDTKLLAATFLLIYCWWLINIPSFLSILHHNRPTFSPQGDLSHLTFVISRIILICRLLLSNKKHSILMLGARISDFSSWCNMKNKVPNVLMLVTDSISQVIQIDWCAIMWRGGGSSHFAEYTLPLHTISLSHTQALGP